MSVIARGFSKYFQPISKILNISSHGNGLPFQVIRAGHFNRQTKHNDKDYEYEVSFNPNEWKFVERLIPPRIIPEVSKKKEYPSGWRPQSEDIKNQPYYTERSKNHMLPVYLHIANKGQIRRTVLKRIRGDIWKLHEDLKEHLETQLNKRVFTCVHEGNCYIQFRGDLVYYVEQWLLSKGF